MNHALCWAIALVLLSSCAAAPRTETSAAASSSHVEYHDDLHNFDVAYPQAWSRAEEPLTILGNPNELLALATFSLREGGGCAPKGTLAAASPSDAIVFLVEFTGAQGMKLPPRPPTFDPLPEPHFDECWDAYVATYRFRDAGGGFQVDVWLGDRVTEETKSDITAALHSLRFGTRDRVVSFFDRVNRILEDRDFGVLKPATKEQRRDAVPRKELRAEARRKLARHPSARLIEVGLGIFLSTSERFGSYEKLMYVVHSGPFPTGDCLDFYDAKTLHYDIGSCFLTDRDL